MAKNNIGNMALQSNNFDCLKDTEAVKDCLANVEFRQCGFGCEVDSAGNVRPIGKQNILKPHDRKGVGSQRYTIYYQGCLHYPPRWLLVASAWLPDWKEGMRCKWKNNDMKDCRASNLAPCTKTEFASYKSNLALIKKAAEQGYVYGEFRPTCEKGIECTKDGIFKVDGKISNNHLRMCNGRLHDRCLCVSRNGIRYYYNTKELIYSAWNGKKHPENHIIPIDGNWANIHADNLKQVPAPEYRRAAYHWQFKAHGDANCLPTIDETIQRLKEFQMECQLNINYLEHGDWSGYHDYIQNTLYDYLMCYSMKTLDQSRSWAIHNVAVVLSDLYDLISTNRMMFSPKTFCTVRLKRFAKERIWSNPYKARPVAVQRAIDDIDINRLADKFNVNKLKQYHHKHGL